MKRRASQRDDDNLAEQGAAKRIRVGTPTPSETKVTLAAGAGLQVDSTSETNLLGDLSPVARTELATARAAAEGALERAVTPDEVNEAKERIRDWQRVLDDLHLDSLDKHHYAQDVFQRLLDAAADERARPGSDRSQAVAMVFEDWINELTDATYWTGDRVIGALVDVAVKFANSDLLDQVYQEAEQGAQGWEGFLDASFEQEFHDALVHAIATQEASLAGAGAGAGVGAGAGAAAAGLDKAAASMRAIWAQMLSDYPKPVEEQEEEEQGDEGDEQDNVPSATDS